MTRSLLLLNLALALGWTLENEDDDGRVQVRYGNTDDAPRLDWLNDQIDADAVGKDGNPLLQALVVKLQFPSDTLSTDALPPDTKAICASIDRLTAAHDANKRAAQDFATQVGEFFSLVGADLARPLPPGCLPPKCVPMGDSRPSDLLQVNQAVLGLLQRQIEAEERIYDRFCAVVERSLDKIAATAIQIQSTQLAHDQWMKQSARCEVASDKIDARFDTFLTVLERFAAAVVENNKPAREQAGTAKAEADAPTSSGRVA